MKKKNCIKRIIIGILLAVFVGDSIYVYLNQYTNTRKTTVKYYDLGKRIEYGGMEYDFESHIYTVDELIDKFDLENHAKRLKQINDDISGAYIVTKVHVMKVENCVEADKFRNNCIVLNKYMDASGTYLDILDLIQKKEFVPLNELNVGQETEYYMLNILSKNDYCKSVWKHLNNAVFYMEFSDYETNEFITRVKIIDGRYGEF